MISALLDRILGHKWTTLVGLVLGMLAEIAGYLLTGGLTNPIAHSIAGFLVAAGGLLRDPRLWQPDPEIKIPPAPPAAGYVSLGITLGLASVVIFGLLMARIVRADEPAPTSSPLSMQLTPDLSLHLNVTVGALAYDVTKGEAIGQFTFGGLYVLESAKLHGMGFGLGGSLISGAVPGATIDAMIASPPLPLGAQPIRIGVLTRYQWLGGVHDWIIAIAPTLQF